MIEYVLRTSYIDGKYQHKLEVSSGAARNTSFFDVAKKVRDSWLSPYSKKINDPLVQQAELNEKILKEGKYATIETRLKLK